MMYQELPTTGQSDWGPTRKSSPQTHVWMTVVLGAAAAVTAPVTLTAAQFLGVFMIGGFLGGFITMLARSATGLAERPETLSLTVQMAAVGSVVAVALTVLTVMLGVRGWAIAAAVAGLYALVRRLFTPVADVAFGFEEDRPLNERL